MEFIKKRLEENNKFFTEEEYEFVLQNELFVTKIYILGLLDFRNANNL